MIQVEEKDLLRVGMALMAATTFVVAFAPSARADENSDFLGCLSNHGVTYKDKAAMLDLAHRIKQDMPQFVAPEAEAFYLERHSDISYNIALIDVQCVQAAMLMNGH